MFWIGECGSLFIYRYKKGGYEQGDFQDERIWKMDERHSNIDRMHIAW